MPNGTNCRHFFRYFIIGQRTKFAVAVPIGPYLHCVVDFTAEFEKFFSLFNQSG
jgi:hypothetical protein